MSSLMRSRPQNSSERITACNSRLLSLFVAVLAVFPVPGGSFGCQALSPVISLHPNFKVHPKRPCSPSIHASSTGTFDIVAASSAILIAATANPDGLDALRYAGAGALCASLSHTGSVPLDVIKTKIQLEPEKYGVLATSPASRDSKPIPLKEGDASLHQQQQRPQQGLIGVASLIVAEEGPAVLLTGATPTLLGYAVQGSLKYGLFEALKPLLYASPLYSPTTTLTSSSPALDVALSNSFAKLPVLLVAGVLAELVASTVLCPLEAARIKNVKDSSTASSGGDGAEGIGKLLSTLQALGLSDSFNGLAAILSKMVPYTAFQLTTYELTTSALYGAFPTIAQDHPSLVFPATVACAATAAVVSSLVSQPGDSILSEINRRTTESPQRQQHLDQGRLESPSSLEAPTPNDDVHTRSGFAAEAVAQVVELGQVGRDLGVSGLMRGTQARLAQMLVIVVVQLLVYDYAKSLVGLPVTGAVH